MPKQYNRIRQTNQNTNNARQNIVVIKICLEENDKVDDIYRIETS